MKKARREVGKWPGVTQPGDDRSRIYTRVLWLLERALTATHWDHRGGQVEKQFPQTQEPMGTVGPLRQSLSYPTRLDVEVLG